MIAAAETAHLPPAAFGFAFAAPRRLPIVIDRDAMALCLATIKRRAIFLDVKFSASTNQIIEFTFRKIAKPITLAPGAHLDAIHYCLIELQTFVGRGRIDIDDRLRAHHAASDVIANRPHCDRSTFIISDDHTTDGHAVAVMHIRRNHNNLHAGESGGIYNLVIESIFG